MKKFYKYIILLLNIKCNDNTIHRQQNKIPRFNLNIKQDESPLYKILDKDIFDNKDKVKSEIDGTVQYYRSILKDENNIFNIKFGKDYWIKNNYKDHAIITICNNKKCSRYNKKNIIYINDYIEKKYLYHIDDTYIMPFIDLAENNKKKGEKSSARYGLCCYSCGETANFKTAQFYFIGKYDIKICYIEVNDFNKLSESDKSVVQEYLSKKCVIDKKEIQHDIINKKKIQNDINDIKKDIKNAKGYTKYEKKQKYQEWNKNMNSIKTQLKNSEIMNKLFDSKIIKNLVLETDSNEFKIFKFNVNKNKYCHFYVKVKKRSAI